MHTGGVTFNRGSRQFFHRRGAILIANDISLAAVVVLKKSDAGGTTCFRFFYFLFRD